MELEELEEPPKKKQKKEISMEEVFFNFPLQKIPKDIWNYMANEKFISEKDAYVLRCVCKLLHKTFSKLDKYVWRNWCIKRFKIEYDLIPTFVDVVKKECFGRYRTFYMGWVDLSSVRWNFEIDLKKKRKSISSLLKFRYMMKRVIKSRQNRTHKQFLDLFLQIVTKCNEEGKIQYPSQLLVLDLNQSGISRDGETIEMLYMIPPAVKQPKYYFTGLEGNYSDLFIKVISRENGRTYQKVLNEMETQAPGFLPYNANIMEKRFSFLSKKDREILGEYFKKDKNVYLGGGYQRSMGGRVSHSYAKSADYTTEMQDKMLRQDVSASSMRELNCKVLLSCKVHVKVDWLYDQLQKMKTI